MLLMSYLNLHLPSVCTIICYTCMILQNIGFLLNLVSIQVLEVSDDFSDAHAKVKHYNIINLSLIFHTEGFLLILGSIPHVLTLMLILTPVQTRCKMRSNQNSPITSAVAFCTHLAQMQFII